MSSLRLTNFKDKINLPKKNFKNIVKIDFEEDMEGKILLEVAFIKDNNIYNKNLKIYKKNLSIVLDKFKNNNFIIARTDTIQNMEISNLNNITNNRHPEYKNENLANFIRNSYKTSFNQKFK